MLYPSLSTRLQNQHLALNQIIDNATDQHLMSNHIPEKWSIHEQITHLASYQPVFMGRMNLILNNENPSFQAYSADNDPEFANWKLKPTATLLQKIDEDRKNLNTLITSMSPSELQRIGNHPKFGDLNVIEWTEFFLLHEAHHIFAIFQIYHRFKNS